MRLHKKYGLTYTHFVETADKRLRFRLRGPMLKKPLSKRRRIGLSIEIHF
jgi:hypothetical protein